MPAYITNTIASPAQPVQLTALYPGTQFVAVNNAATDSGITTSQQVAIGPTPGNSPVTLVITNSTNQQATGQYSPEDALGTASYENLSGCIIPAGSSLPYNLQGGWMRFTFATAPSSGSLIVSR
jgi:membrane-associated protease RseP (regulator of RpoE activity)